MGDGNTLAALYAMDNVYEADRSTLGRYVHTPVVRFKRSLSEDSYVGFLYADFYPDATNEKLYDYLLTRLKLTFQVNQYLFFRTIGEYNDYRRNLNTEFLASFTYIPGTVIYLGYGSIFNRVRWDGTEYVEADNLLEMRRGLFLKMSYLWRS